MIFLMLEFSMSEKGDMADAVAAAAEAGAPRTSAATILPLGPEPCSACNDTPLAAASFRAYGEAITRAPSGALDAGTDAGVGDTRATAGAAVFGADGTLPGVVATAGVSTPSDPSTDAFAIVNEANDATSAASSTCTNTGAPTRTPAVPSATNICARTPSSCASHSIVALSVSISASTSPAEITSPTAFFQATRVPSAIVGDSAGMVITS